MSGYQLAALIAALFIALGLSTDGEGSPATFTLGLIIGAVTLIFWLGWVAP